MTKPDLANGVKFDDNKLRFDLIPPRPFIELSKVYTYGASKYADRNWEKGMKWGRVFAAMMRHIYKWAIGEVYDSESGLHHLAHAAFGCFTLMEYGWQRPLKKEFIDMPDLDLQSNADDFFRMPEVKS